MYSFKKLILRDDVYSDATQITDENGFQVLDVPATAVLLNYSEVLGIRHWADDSRAYVELTQEQQRTNARRIVACVNACEGLSTENLEENPLIKDGVNHLNALIYQKEQRINDLKSLISDINTWGADQLIEVPLPLRKRMQAAIAFLIT